jgi:hypothetical protein
MSKLWTFGAHHLTRDHNIIVEQACLCVRARVCERECVWRKKMYINHNGIGIIREGKVVCLEFFIRSKLFRIFNKKDMRPLRTSSTMQNRRCDNEILPLVLTIHIYRNYSIVNIGSWRFENHHIEPWTTI